MLMGEIVTVVFTLFPVHFVVNVAAIIGGTVGGVVGGGLCICLALCITVCCCCYHKKKTQRRTATTATTATPMTSVQPTVAINQLRMQQTGQQDSDNPPEYNPHYISYPETYTQPSPYPPVTSGTLPPTYPQAGSTVPQTLLPTPLWVVGPRGTLPASYPPQSLDVPSPYPTASPFYTFLDDSELRIYDPPIASRHNSGTTAREGELCNIQNHYWHPPRRQLVTAVI